MMQKWCVTLCVCLMGVSSAMATPTILVQGGPYQYGSGGEFKATVMSEGFAGNPVGSTFQTFCVEKTETLSLGSTYYAVVNTAAVAGGGGAVGGSDPLSTKTAWLYDQFLNGTLSGYNTSTTALHLSSAGALQNAIWHLEGETWSYSSLEDDFYDAANASTWSNIGNIRVLNLYGDAGLTQNAQDILCRITPVPAPAAILLVGIGTTVVGSLRRRRTL